MDKDPEAEHWPLRKRMCWEGVLNKTHYLDNEYLSYGLKDLPVGSTLPIMYAQFSEHARKRMCWEGVLNKTHYLDNEYLSYGLKDLPVGSTLPIMYAQFSEHATNFACVDCETRAERINRWSTIAENIYEAEVFTSHKKK